MDLLYGLIVVVLMENLEWKPLGRLLDMNILNTTIFIKCSEI